jgi:hypothetical protein
MAEDYLVDHALRNAWCNPKQDLQVILKPARISFPSGVRRQVDHSWSTIPLPTTQDLYHVYQIGQVSPAALGLTPGQMAWRSLAHVMVTENLYADVYVNSGLHLNRADCYVVYTEERNLLLAVKDQPVIASLQTEPLYLRLYSNAYFDSFRSRTDTQAIQTNSIVVTDINSAALFQNELTTVRAQHGLTLLFINGVVQDGFVPAQTRAGDVLEYVYDSTIKQVVEFPVSSLQTFVSELDAKMKYLLHYTADQADGVMIDYRDDIDVYLVRKYTRGSNTNAWRGVYFHKNAGDALRQLTHRDYSIPSAYVEAYVQSNPEWTNSDELTVRLHIRNSGWKRPLIFEHSRVQELYKLSHPDIVRAMVGLDATVEIWQAKNLENSKYVAIMDALGQDVTRTLVEDAYGYNAVSRLAGNTPLQVKNVSGRQQVSLPYGLWTNSTMYEFDATGKLLGFYIHSSGPEYTPYNAACASVEGVVGRGGYATSTTFGAQTLPYDANYNYRFYITGRKVGKPDPEGWQDVTGDNTKYMLVNGTIQWLVDPAYYFTAVRSDERFLAYQLPLTSENGLLRFSIDGDGDYPTGAAHGVFYIPTGRLDLWLNGMALIENLDYQMVWPQIVITNKRYLVPGETQVITVRGTGFCNPDMSRDPPAEFGYVNYGLLSRNRRFDIRDDKVLRLIINGRTLDRSVLKYAETTSAIQVAGIPDGSPYQIDDVVVPLRRMVNEDDYAYRAKSKAVDQAISDYLSLKLPEPTITDPVMVPTSRYPVYSPFTSTIMHDLANGRLSTEGFRGQYSDRTLKLKLAPYEYLLAYDPVFRTSIDDRYVAIHPHNLQTLVELDIYQWRMLSRAAKIYLNDRVDVSAFTKVKDTLI